MGRREFIMLLGGAAASWPFAAQPQQPAMMKRIAIVHPSEPVANLVASYHRFYHAFFAELGRVGYAEGNNLIVKRYSAGGQPDRYAELARDVADTRQAATTTIPIVTIAGDPVVGGLVSNIARPGGNITGTAISAGFEIWGKRMGLLKEVIPKLSNISVILQTRKFWEGPNGTAIRQAAESISIPLNAVTFEEKIDNAAYQHVFAAFDQDRPDALMVSEFPVHFTNRVIIVQLAAKHRVPVLYTWREFVETGGLMSYAFDMVELGRSCAYQIGQILNGTKPGDIPFNLVARYELALNLKTAKSLDIEFPATLLGIADFVVE